MMKNTILSAFLLAISISLFGQTVNIDILSRSEIEIEEVWFFNLSQEVMFGSMEFQDSLHLEFEAKADDSYNLIFEKDDKKYRRQFWLGEGEIKVYVYLDGKELHIEKVEGSDVYQEWENYVQKLISLKAEKEQKISWLKEMLASYDHRAFSLMIAMNYQIQNSNNKAELTWLSQYLAEKNSAIKAHILYEDLSSRLEKMLDDAPIDFSRYYFLNLEEESQQLSLAKNQLTVLDLWFVRCPPCVKDHKEIKKDVEDGLYQDKNLSFIGISRDRDFSLWQAYVEKHQLPWTNLNVEYTEGPNLIDELSISGFPTYLVLNDKGEILKTYNSYKQLRPFLLLQE